MPLDEISYAEGRDAAYRLLLQTAYQLLDLPEDMPSCWAVEREQIIQLLRSACSDFGDNQWDSNDSLVDVIEKHLLQHLYAREPAIKTCVIVSSPYKLEDQIQAMLEKKGISQNDIIQMTQSQSARPKEKGPIVVVTIWYRT